MITDEVSGSAKARVLRRYRYWTVCENGARTLCWGYLKEFGLMINSCAGKNVGFIGGPLRIFWTYDLLLGVIHTRLDTSSWEKFGLTSNCR